MTVENPLNLDPQFKSVAERMATEREERLAQCKDILSFGVEFLDRALGGVFKNDLIILGAKTGLGKTSLSTIIASKNAGAGKRVHYFALEAERSEIERRMKYSLLYSLMRDINADGYKSLSYLDWYMGKQDHLTQKYESMIDKQAGEKYRGFHTFYRTRDFTAQQFEKAVLAIQNQTDLIILDHLHYVDSDDPSENRGYKIVVKKIRDVALDIGKPVIVVAHVRKGDRKSGQLVPGLEDFHGTSDVPKIATKAIMIAPAYDHPTPSSYLWPTYISPAKCRFDGSRTRYTAVVNFDTRTVSYESDFMLGKINMSGDKFELIGAQEEPYWAKSWIP